MTVHVWMVMSSMLMASLATVNYNYEKPDKLPFRFFPIRQVAKPPNATKSLYITTYTFYPFLLSLVSQPLRFVL